jgi:hypothetical protein
MTATLAVTATLLTMWQTPTDKAVLSGEAAFYSPRLMPQVCETRGMDMTGFAGAVALMSCGDLGRTVWVFGEPMLVCDCSMWVHFEMNRKRGRIVDLDWATWERHGLPLAPVPVTVSFVPPRERRHEPR